MSTSPSWPGASGPVSRVERATALGGAFVLLAGVVAGVAGAALDSEPTVGVGAGLAAGGLATTVYGLGSVDRRPWRQVSAGGLAVAWLAVAGAALVPPGESVPVPGGTWGVAYAVGLVAVALVETAVQPGDPRRDAVSDPSTTPEEESDEVSSLAVAIARSGAGGWTWELRSPEGRVLASAPRTYDAATDAHRAATGVTEWVEGDPRIHTDAADPGREDSASERRSLPSGDAPSLPAGDKESRETPEETDPGSNREFVGVPAGDAGVFELEETEAGWRWRLRFEDDAILAESARGYPGLDATRRAVERVRTQAPGAGALTYDPGAFEVYRETPGEEEWGWRLRADDGEVIAAGVAPVGSREEGFGAVARVKETAEPGDPEVRAVEGHHRWTLVADGEVLAQSPHGFETPEDAREAFQRVARTIPDAGVLELDPAGFEVAPRPGGTWGWRLRHRDGRVLARSPPQATRDRSIEGLRTLQYVVPDAEVSIGERETSRIIEEALSDAAEARSLAENLRTPEDEDDGEGEDSEGEERENEGEAQDGSHAHDPESADDGTGTDREGDDGSDSGETVVAVAEDDGWRWELRRGGTVFAAGEPTESRSVAADAGAVVATAVENATVVEVDPVAVEVYRRDGWRWRLVDAEGATLARSPGGVDRVQTARRNVETALDALSGDPEVYRGEGWRWRVRQDGSAVAESGHGFESPEAAREAFAALSADPETVVVECEAALEVAPADGGWGLRIRANDGRVLGAGSETYDSAEDAREAATRLVAGPVVTEEGSGADARGETGE